MKRSPELRDLSEQHHYGLVAARNLRHAAEGRKPLEPTVTEFLQAWEAEIQPHFRCEEEILLPELARRLPEDDPLIVRTLVEHVRLRRAVRELHEANAARQVELAAWIGRALDDHIRFEERQLFPRIEAVCEGPLLTGLGAAVQEACAAIHHACSLDTR